jgi:hypothetical protein
LVATIKAIEPFLLGTDKANEVRDRLGLLHRKKTQELVMLEMQVSELADLPQARPTFVDAGMHQRFQAIANHPTNRSKKDWGFTLDLAKFANTSIREDGLPERVVARIEVHDVSTIKLYPLGQITDEDRGTTTTDDDTKYAECLLGTRSQADILSRIKAIL